MAEELGSKIINEEVVAADRKGLPHPQAPQPATRLTRLPQTPSTYAETDEEQARVASETTAKSIKPKTRFIEHPNEAENNKLKGLELDEAQKDSREMNFKPVDDIEQPRTRTHQG